MCISNVRTSPNYCLFTKMSKIVFVFLGNGILMLTTKNTYNCCGSSKKIKSPPTVFGAVRGG